MDDRRHANGNRSRPRASFYNAAWLKDAQPTRLGTAASRAKLYASEMANRVAAKAVQIHGSVGYSRETDVERMYRDARVITIYEGTSEIQRIIIARACCSIPTPRNRVRKNLIKLPVRISKGH